MITSLILQGSLTTSSHWQKVVNKQETLISLLFYLDTLFYQYHYIKRQSLNNTNIKSLM